MTKKLITVGIPAYKAQSTIRNALASIQVQSVKDQIEVIISNDNPDDKDGYKEIIKDYPELSIKEIDCEENGGPGIARKVCLDNCDTPYITFIDADDVFATPYSLEHLMAGINAKNDKSMQMIMCQGAFLQECETPNGTMFMPRNDVGHPWVFGRLYLVDFLKKNKINFSSLRAMEDGEFNAKIRMLVDGTPYGINIIDEPVYYWKQGSEHSITRTIWKGHYDDIPIYNYGSCQVGSAICFKQALDFVNETNPFNPSISRVAAEMLIEKYFTYYETLQNYDVYAEQINYISIWWYKNCFVKYASNVTEEMLNTMFMQMLTAKAGDFKAFPKETFEQWYKRISSSELDNFDEIRSRIPEELKQLEHTTGCSL